MTGGTIERSCYSPHYVLIPREIMRETTRQLCPRAAKQQAGVDRKRERSFSGLSARGTWHVESSLPARSSLFAREAAKAGASFGS
jgi:hypothetical protein